MKMYLLLLLVFCFITIAHSIKLNENILLLDDWKLTILYCPPSGNHLLNK